MGIKFEDYLQEFEEGRVEDLNYPLVLGIAKSICPKYPPEVYSPERIWNEDTMKQLADEFFVEMLLDKNQLKYHFLTQESFHGFKRAITRDFKNFLRNKKRRTEAINLYRRTLAILSNEDFFDVIEDFSSSNARVVRIAGSNHNASQTCQKLEEVIEVMFTISIPPVVRYRADSKKESHLISTDELHRLLTETFEIVDKPVTIGMVFEALKYRLNLLEIETLGFEELMPAENGEDLDFLEVFPSPADESVESILVGSECAFDIFERLSDRQREIFNLWYLDFTLVDIGNQIGISKSTVYDEIKKIQQEISIEQPTDEEAEIITQHLFQLCNEFSNTADGNA